jgi:hypothetical protein
MSEDEKKALESVRNFLSEYNELCKRYSVTIDTVNDDLCVVYMPDFRPVEPMQDPPSGFPFDLWWRSVERW